MQNLLMVVMNEPESIQLDSQILGESAELAVRKETLKLS